MMFDSRSGMALATVVYSVLLLGTVGEANAADVAQLRSRINFDGSGPQSRQVISEQISILTQRISALQSELERRQEEEAAARYERAREEARSAALAAALATTTTNHSNSTSAIRIPAANQNMTASIDPIASALSRETGPAIVDFRLSSTTKVDNLNTPEIENGTLTFTYEDRRISLVSYGNGAQEGFSDAPNQCVDLIKTYAYELGYLDSPEPNASMLGHGHVAAQGFTDVSGGEFEYFGGAAADDSELPIEGSIISISDSDHNEFGHVGIVADVAWVDDSTYKAVLFDQNWPSAQWKDVTFTKQSDGTWSGTMTNSEAPDGYELVSGWANPV